MTTNLVLSSEKRFGAKYHLFISKDFLFVNFLRTMLKKDFRELRELLTLSELTVTPHPITPKEVTFLDFLKLFRFCA
jgi:hypothetical protein